MKSKTISILLFVLLAVPFSTHAFSLDTFVKQYVAYLNQRIETLTKENKALKEQLAKYENGTKVLNKEPLQGTEEKALKSKIASLISENVSLASFISRLNTNEVVRDELLLWRSDWSKTFPKITWETDSGTAVKRAFIDKQRKNAEEITKIEMELAKKGYEFSRYSPTYNIETLSYDQVINPAQNSSRVCSGSTTWKDGTCQLNCINCN